MRYLIYIIILISSISLYCQTTRAQESNTKLANDLSILMDQTRNNNPITIKTKDILESDPVTVLGLLGQYKNDSSSNVRRHAYAFEWQVGRANKTASIRQQVVSSLIKGLSDPEPLVWQHVADYLLDFNSGDFSESSKSFLHQLLVNNINLYKTVLIAGAANMTGEMLALEKLLIDEAKLMEEAKDPLTKSYSGMWYGKIGWAVRIARARMGSKTDITKAINLVESEPDNVTRVTRLLNDLAYIRQPEIVVVLQRYLDSSERLPSVREPIPGSCYCQYALDFLAQIIDGFPVKSVGPGGYSQAEIEQARKWMKNKNNWINAIRR